MPTYRDLSFLMSNLYFALRFDIFGLSPDAPEDEPGIKQATENGILGDMLNVFSS